jgi:hypothetical protein
MEQQGFKREMLIDVWQRSYEAIFIFFIINSKLIFRIFI